MTWTLAAFALAVVSAACLIALWFEFNDAIERILQAAFNP